MHLFQGTDDDAPPALGELVYGCRHPGSACGRVRSVEGRHPESPERCFKVTEDWNDRHLTVRRESNGCLYEVEWRPDFPD